jgi:hypothetical protein
MAISQNFLTGRMRKSAGGSRFSSWRGLNIVASKPMEVRQNVTPAVQLNRDKMSRIGKMVSKLNPFVGLFYSLGISKTTPFADTVKFFRNRLTDLQKFDASLFTNASFGTGNTPSPTYHIVEPAIDSIVISPSNISPMWDNDDCILYFIAINDIGTKTYVEQVVQPINDNISLNLTSSDFIVGDKVLFAVKPIKTRPGTDLSGSVKFTDATAFVTLTA